MIERLPFFTEPRGPQMRWYESLRAYHQEGLSVEEAAARGGYTPGSFRNLLTRFAKQPTSEFFWPSDDTPTQTKEVDPRPA